MTMFFVLVAVIIVVALAAAAGIFAPRARRSRLVDRDVAYREPVYREPAYREPVDEVVDEPVARRVGRRSRWR
jgi:hypothetical protein